MLIRYMEYDDKGGVKFRSPLIKPMSNQPSPQKSELDLQCYSMGSQGVACLDNCYFMVSIGKDLLSKESVHVPKELKSGLFKKKQPYTVLEEQITTKFVPDIEGVYIVGKNALNGSSDVITNGYGLNLEIDPETRLPKIKQPNTLEEAIDLIMVDPRFISSLDPYAEYCTENNVKTLIMAVKSSFVKLTCEQGKYGVEFTEKERNARTKFSTNLLQRALDFSTKVKEALNAKDKININSMGG